ncbi:unnamed protein product [Auanema sp. JU1783]|nr:unnamed protein product [Auanema sp. JU1783]
MDELMAIIIIVILCCVMFFAWLVSMATCPDAMVSFLSGQRNESNYSSSHESKELIRHEEDDAKMMNSVSSVYLHMNSGRRPSDKKLSVVPEQDEQLTVQSTIHSLRPTILRIAQNQPPPFECSEDNESTDLGPVMTITSSEPVIPKSVSGIALARVQTEVDMENIMSQNV